MEKIALGLCLSFVMLVGACGYVAPGEKRPVAQQCVLDAICVSINASLKCCDVTKTLQKDAVNCPVKAGLIGGKPLMCVTAAPACVADGACVANNPTLTCCTAGKTLQADAVNCQATGGLVGGMLMMCMTASN